MSKQGKFLIIGLTVLAFFFIWKHSEQASISTEPIVQGISSYLDPADSPACKSLELSMEISNLPAGWNCRENSDGSLLLSSDSFRIELNYKTYEPYCQDTTTYDDTGAPISDSECEVTQFYIKGGFILSQYNYANELKEIGGIYENSYGERISTKITPILAMQTESDNGKVQQLVEVLKLID
ncbi:MAG: hypothetical protein ABIE03_00960 [Patescibacteria group bacterium]|nr:hypothetical protein [Patescibacteria group bacterium]